jgi:hypothetical protein
MDPGLLQVLNIAEYARRQEIYQVLYNAFQGRVSSGPFQSMALPEQSSWGGGDVGPKVLGCYEAELHDFVMRAVERAPDSVVNVGCAEGYYAIGLAGLLPKAEVFAFDIDEKAQQICRLAAGANGAGERMTVAGLFTPADLDELTQRPGRKLLVIDCEGGELPLLNPILAPRLAECDMIIECHDFLDRTITPTLTARFSATHTVQLVSEGARNPNDFAVLRNWHSRDRWLAVAEGRPEMMQWLICWSKQEAM